MPHKFILWLLKHRQPFFPKLNSLHIIQNNPYCFEIRLLFSLQRRKLVFMGWCLFLLNVPFIFSVLFCRHLVKWDCKKTIVSTFTFVITIFSNNDFSLFGRFVFIVNIPNAITQLIYVEIYQGHPLKVALML